MAKQKNEVETKMIRVSEIRDPKFVARMDFDKDELQELMDSIEAHGLIQPIRVKGVKGGYEVVAGHRRLLAHRKLKLDKIRCEVVSSTETEHEIVKLHENKKRTELSDIEEAKSFEHLKKITGKTNKQIAREANVSEGYVTQKIAIMKYPACVFNAVSTGQLTFSSARELVRIGDLKVLEDYVDHACRSGITPKVAKQWADDWAVMQKINNGEITEAIKEREGSTPDTIKLPCFVCGHYFKPENTSMIRCCKDDLTAIKKAMKIVDEPGE
jgi:ParB family chromosome partitioning protein